MPKPTEQQMYAVIATRIISQARRDGYDPRKIADVINALCLPSTSAANWGPIGDIRTTALSLCYEYAQYYMEVDKR